MSSRKCILVQVSRKELEISNSNLLCLSALQASLVVFKVSTVATWGSVEGTSTGRDHHNDSMETIIISIINIYIFNIYLYIIIIV